MTRTTGWLLTALVAVCAALVGSNAQAQPGFDPYRSPNGRAVLDGTAFETSSSYETRSVPFGPRYRAFTQVGDGLGWDNGQTFVDAMFPYHINPWVDLIFLDIRGFGTHDADGGGGNLGVGYRRYIEEANVLVGFSAWLDADGGYQKPFYQAGASAEAITPIFEARVNGYWNLGGQTEELFQGIAGNPYYRQNQIIVNNRRITENQFDGVDGEIGGPLPYLGQYGLNAYLGMYWLQNADAGETTGFKFRGEANIHEDLQVGIEVRKDQDFGTQTWFNIMFQLPRASWRDWWRRPFFRSRSGAEQLARQVERTYRIPVRRIVTDTPTPLINPADGQPYFVFHVDPNATTSQGTPGMFENPFRTMEAARLANNPGVDIIRVVGANNLTTPNGPLAVTQPFALLDNQRLLSSSVHHAINTQFGTLRLPGYNGAPLPLLNNSSTAAPSSVIQLAGNDTEVSGFAIVGRDGNGAVQHHGITNVAGVNNFNINRNAFGEYVNAINLFQVTGLGRIDSNTIIGNRTGFSGTSDTGVLVANTSGTFDLQLTNNEISNNFVGVGLIGSGTAVLNGTNIYGNSILGNTAQGLLVDLSGNASGGYNIYNNTIGGSELGLTFFVNGQTLLSPFSLTNNATSANIATILFDLVPTGLFFDTAGGVSTPFTPVNGTEITTGLASVNGTVAPPGTVADNAQQIAMGFTNFNPGETFQFNIDIDPDPAIDGPVLGSQLVGANIVTTFNNGRLIAGTMVPVPGFPQASAFSLQSPPAGEAIRFNVSGNATLLNSNVLNNTIANADAGVILNTSGTSTTQLLRINNNVFSTLSGSAVNVSTNDTSNVQDILIQGNTITAATDAGIRVQTNGSSQLSQLIIQANSITGTINDIATVGPQAPNGDGIFLLRADSSLFGADGGAGAFNGLGDVVIGNNTIIGETGMGNVISNNDGDAIKLIATGAGNVVNTLLYDGNTFNNNQNGFSATLFANAIYQVVNDGNLITNSRDHAIAVVTNNQTAFGTTSLQSRFLGDTIINSDANNDNIGSGFFFQANDNSFQNVLIGAAANGTRMSITGGQNGVRIQNNVTGGLVGLNRWTVQGIDIANVVDDGITYGGLGLDGTILSIGGQGVNQNVTIANAGDDGIQLNLLTGTNTINILGNQNFGGTTITGSGQITGRNAVDANNDTVVDDDSRGDGIRIVELGGTNTVNIIGVNSNFNVGRGLDVESRGTTTTYQIGQYIVGSPNSNAVNLNNFNNNGLQGVVFFTTSNTSQAAFINDPTALAIAGNLYHDFGSPALVTTNVTFENARVLNNGAVGTGADGAVFSAGTNTQMNLFINTVTATGNAGDDIALLTHVSAEMTNNGVNLAPNGPPNTNIDVVGQDAVGIMNLVFGIVDTDANGTADSRFDTAGTFRGITGESLRIATAGSATPIIGSVLNGTFESAMTFRPANRAGFTRINTFVAPAPTLLTTAGIATSILDPTTSNALTAQGNVFVTLGVVADVDNVFSNANSIVVTNGVATQNTILYNAGAFGFFPIQ